MTDDEYFPVPLAHLTSPFVPPAPDEPSRPRESPPPRAREHAEPFGMLDVAELPETYGVDEVTVLARDPFTLFGHWEVTPDSLAAARARLGEDGQLVLRLMATSGPVIDDPLPRASGRGYLPAPYPGAWLVPIVGLRAADGRFEAIASAPAVRVPSNQPVEGEVEWMEIGPARSRGAMREPPVAVRAGLAGEPGGALRAQRGLWPTPPAPIGRSASPSATSPTSPTSPTKGSGR